MMPTRIPVFLFLVALLIAQSGCDTRTASSDRSDQQGSTVAALPGADKTATAIADEGAAVAKTNCLTCHSEDKNVLLAPPFSSIAQRYSGNQKAADMLAASVKNGSHGKWADYRGVVMPPQPQLSERENKSLVQWILNQ